MSEALEVKAEVLKLARLLRRDPQSLEYLEQLPAGEVQVLREQVMDMLFSAHGATLGRLAAASKLLPVGVVAAIAERAFGPVLTARIAGLLQPERAVEVAAKLSTGFLADTAAELDPRRAAGVIARIPPDQIAEVTRELVRRAEHVTIGRFVGHLPDESADAALAVIDADTLIRVAFVLEDPSHVDRLFDPLPGHRIVEVIDAAAADGRWEELQDVVLRLPEPLRQTYLRMAAARGAAAGSAPNR